jgi:hypothetical protein
MTMVVVRSPAGSVISRGSLYSPWTFRQLPPFLQLISRHVVRGSEYYGAGERNCGAVNEWADRSASRDQQSPRPLSQRVTRSTPPSLPWRKTQHLVLRLEFVQDEPATATRWGTVCLVDLPELTGSCRSTRLTRSRWSPSSRSTTRLRRTLLRRALRRRTLWPARARWSKLVSRDGSTLSAKPSVSWTQTCRSKQQRRSRTEMALRGAR